MTAVSHAVSTLCAVVVVSVAAASCALYDPALVDNVPVKDAGAVHVSQPPPATMASCELDGCAKVSEATSISAQKDSGADLLDESDSGVDLCPGDESKAEPGICGCSHSELDSDLDGAPDCIDGCPQDEAKADPGVCGCGMADVDSDGDRTLDCVDACPRDARKTTMGACSCGEPEDDRDADGTADCLDSCPDDFAKTEPGTCGCANQDPVAPTAGAIYCAKPALRHRYSFNSTDDTAVDSKGGADGRIVYASQRGGALVLNGDFGDGGLGEGHAVLPISVWSNLTSATIEVWFVWRGVGDAGANEWQRIFDVGRQQDDGMTRYWFLSPYGEGGVRTAFSLDGPIDHEVSVTSPQPARRDVPEHVACIVDADTWTLSLFYDGVLQGSTMLSGTLPDLSPDSLWLGRSHFDYDPAFHGEILEFRIYDAALSSAQLQASAAAGPDYDFAP